MHPLVESQMIYSRVPIWRGPIFHNIMHCTAITAADRKSDFKLQTDTPYLAFTCELWGVYLRRLEKIDSVITTLQRLSIRQTFKQRTDLSTCHHNKTMANNNRRLKYYMNLTFLKEKSLNCCVTNYFVTQLKSNGCGDPCNCQNYTKEQARSHSTVR